MEILRGGVTRVVVHCPRQFKWQPGQHCFISIPGISPVQSHPFTIVSLSSAIALDGQNDVVLLIRAMEGFTKRVAELAKRSEEANRNSGGRLAAIAEAQKTQIHTRSWIDGPYGDSHPAFDRKYHGVVCISGGSGITASLPWVTYVAAKMKAAAHCSARSEDNSCKTRSVHLFWSVRDLDWIQWAERELSTALRDVMRANNPFSETETPNATKREEFKTEEILPVPNKSRYRLAVTIFVTARNVDEARMSAAASALLSRAGVGTNDSYVQVEVRNGRPDYETLLPRMMDRKRNIVLAW